MYVTETKCIIDTQTERDIPGVVERRYYVMPDNTVVLQDESRFLDEQIPVFNAKELRLHGEKQKVHKVEAQVVFPDDSLVSDQNPVLVYIPILRAQESTHAASRNS